MDGLTHQSVFRITIKELVFEFEGADLAQRAQDSLAVLLGRSLSANQDDFEPHLIDGDSSTRRGRRPKGAEAGIRRRRPRADAATAQIRGLRDEGYFAEPRRASEVKATLKVMGHDLENRQIYATLKYMADKGILYRSPTGEDGVWLYSAVAREA